MDTKKTKGKISSSRLRRNESIVNNVITKSYHERNARKLVLEIETFTPLPINQEFLEELNQLIQKIQ